MIGSIMSIVFIIFGILMVVFCKKIAKHTSDFYYNLLHHRFSVTGYQIAFLMGGIVFVLLGILSLLKIIEWRK